MIVFDPEVIVGSGIVASLLLAIITKLLGKIEGRFGSLITQLALLIFCIIVVSVVYAFNVFIPENILKVIWFIFSSGIAFYEVIFKSIYQKAIKNVK
jgi:hypothetical protein